MDAGGWQRVPSGPVPPTLDHPLSGRSVWWAFGGSLLCILLGFLFFLQFTDALDVPDPSRARLQGMLAIWGVFIVGSVGFLLWPVRDGDVHPVWIAASLVLGAGIGLFYGLAVYPSDFYEEFRGPSLVGFLLMQVVVLLPLGLTGFLTGLIMWLRRPDRSPSVAAGLVGSPLALQAGTHLGMLVALWSTLSQLIETARAVHESPAPGLLLVVILVVLAAALRARR